MRQLLTETPLSIPAAATRVGVSARTVKRWACDGIRNVRLEAFKAGGSWRTTAEALARFVAATSPLVETRPTPAARSRANDRVMRELEAAGWA